MYFYPFFLIKISLGGFEVSHLTKAWQNLRVRKALIKNLQDCPPKRSSHRQ